jgi:hypothetical protein
MVIHTIKLFKTNITISAKISVYWKRTPCFNPKPLNYMCILTNMRLYPVNVPLYSSRWDITTLVHKANRLEQL